MGGRSKLEGAGPWEGQPCGAEGGVPRLLSWAGVGPTSLLLWRRARVVAPGSPPVLRERGGDSFLGAAVNHAHQRVAETLF